jgi:spore coat polysaccharide biosynthesis predicted glycosyltransferase SpsG
MKQKRVLLVCYSTSEVGIGHLSRLRTLALNLKRKKDLSIKFLIFSQSRNIKNIGKLENKILPIDSDFFKELHIELDQQHYDLIIFDLYKEFDNSNIKFHLQKIKNIGVKVVAVDCLVDFHEVIDLIWIPSFHFQKDKVVHNIKFGWDCYLLQRKKNQRNYKDNNCIIVLTGGSDPTNLNEKLPLKLDSTLNEGQRILWVQGPYAKRPCIPETSKLNWSVKKDPEDVHTLMLHSQFAITTYGVSFFELIQYGIPTVVFSPFKDRDELELNLLRDQHICLVSHDYISAASKLRELIENNDISEQISINALDRMRQNGTEELSKAILKLIGIK